MAKVMLIHNIYIFRHSCVSLVTVNLLSISLEAFLVEIVDDNDNFNGIYNLSCPEEYIFKNSFH